MLPYEIWVECVLVRDKILELKENIDYNIELIIKSAININPSWESTLKQEYINYLSSLFLCIIIGSEDLLKNNRLTEQQLKNAHAARKIIKTNIFYDLLNSENKNVTLETTFKKVSDLIKDKDDCPLPLSVIPNHMGINLCSVDAISWQKQSDGQLTCLTIHFIPGDKK